MGRTTKRRPGDCFFIEVHSRGRFVDLVRPVSDEDCRFSGIRCEHAGHACATREKALKKAMLFEQAFGVANVAVMALDEDSRVTRDDYAGGRERARAGGFDAEGLALCGKLREKRVQLCEGKRLP